MGMKSYLHDQPHPPPHHDLPDIQPDTYLGTRWDARYEFWHNTWATVAEEQHMNGWLACQAEWYESHLNWSLAK